MRPIDADALKIETVGICDANGNCYGAADVVFAEEIANTPTIDAADQKLIEDLRRENELKSQWLTAATEALEYAMRSQKLCAFCVHRNRDCQTYGCDPKWSGDTPWRYAAHA